MSAACASLFTPTEMKINPIRPSDAGGAISFTTPSNSRRWRQGRSGFARAWRYREVIVSTTGRARSGKQGEGGAALQQLGAADSSEVSAWASPLSRLAPICTGGASPGGQRAWPARALTLHCSSLARRLVREPRNMPWTHGRGSSVRFILEPYILARFATAGRCLAKFTAVTTHHAQDIGSARATGISAC